MKKVSMFLACLVTLLTMSPLQVSAMEVTETASVVTEQIGGGVVVPCADQIETVLRVYNGVVQYRRWNATWGYWVDPYWINL
ncbi:hypothetical protein HNQ56_001943 [Anaerotaenia torta]|uniref:hypothetical protein n=1 Tax=Anaerotaenia torta TaxID=433293 RepID=UPI003D19BB05